MSYANVMATVAVFVALGGGAYAAFKLPNNSVGTKQIRNNAVTPSKLASSTVKLLKGKAGPAGPRGSTGPAGPAGSNGKDGSVAGLAAGGDLTGTYPNPSVDRGKVQARVSGTCSSHSAIASVNSDGTVGCRSVPGDTILMSSSGQPATITPSGGAFTPTVAEVPVDGIGLQGGQITSGTIDTANGGGAGGAQVPESLPRAGTITAASAFFSLAASVTLPPAAVVTIQAQLYESTAPSNTFTPVPGALVAVTPPLSGPEQLGTIGHATVTGLSIPVAQDTRLMWVFSAQGSGVAVVQPIQAFVSASLTIS